MSDITKLTDADVKALERAPKGWFEWFELRARCPEFRLKRLEMRGLVEIKREGVWPDIEIRYRVIRKPADAAIKAWYKAR